MIGLNSIRSVETSSHVFICGYSCFVQCVLLAHFMVDTCGV